MFFRYHWTQWHGLRFLDTLQLFPLLQTFSQLPLALIPRLLLLHLLVTYTHAPMVTVAKNQLETKWCMRVTVRSSVVRCRKKLAWLCILCSCFFYAKHWIMGFGENESLFSVGQSDGRFLRKLRIKRILKFLIPGWSLIWGHSFVLSLLLTKPKKCLSFCHHHVA